MNFTEERVRRALHHHVSGVWGLLSIVRGRFKLGKRYVQTVRLCWTCPAAAAVVLCLGPRRDPRALEHASAGRSIAAQGRGSCFLVACRQGAVFWRFSSPELRAKRRGRGRSAGFCRFAGIRKHATVPSLV